VTAALGDLVLAAGNNYYNGPDLWKGLGVGGIVAIVIAVLVVAFAVFVYSRSRKGPGPMG
jgi:O-antigen ligase